MLGFVNDARPLVPDRRIADIWRLRTALGEPNGPKDPLKGTPTSTGEGGDSWMNVDGWHGSSWNHEI